MIASDVRQQAVPSGPHKMPKASASDPLRAAAEKLEAGFWAEMLKSAQPEDNKNSFSSGIGETQFASFLRTAHADALVRGGGLGLAETIYQSGMPPFGGP